MRGVRWWVVSPLAAAAGCGGSIEPPHSAPVGGTVTVRGKPAAGVRVRFHPQFDIGAVKFVPYGETDGGGRFTLSTGAGGNGAPPGDYVVTFERPKIVSDRANSGIETEEDEFKGEYADPAGSPWRVTVEDRDNAVGPFRLP